MSPETVLQEMSAAEGSDIAEAGVFLSWAPFTRRTQTLARRFGLAPALVAAPWFKRPLYAPLKYPYQAARTVALLARARPREVWVMDPPLPAVALAWAYSRVRRVPLVVDVHTVAFYDLKWRLLRPFEKPLLRAARVVIVTNEPLARRAAGWGLRAEVLPDPPPSPPPASPEDSPAEPPEVTVVATFSPDEPIDLLPALAERLAPTTVHVTGRPRGDLSRWPANLRPTGFLEEDDYWRLLRRSAVILVLTRRPDTLLSGGYEALSLGRPLVVSDHAVLREYFGDAAVYADSTPESLAAAVRRALADGDTLSRRLRDLAERRAAGWRRAADRVAQLVRGSEGVRDEESL